MNRDRAAAIGREPHGSADDPDLLDFSANTNPAVPDGAERVYRAAFDRARTYPPEPPEGFRAAAADAVDCAPESVVPTPGGLAAIRTAVALAVDDGDTALVPTPSFGEYAREVRLRGGEPAFVDAESVLDADPSDHALAVVCHPNNPTGTAYDRDALLSFADRCRAADTVLLVDEAFLGFTDRASLAGTDGIVVARALTKLFGLPGIRAGYAVATGDLASAVRGARRAWNLSAPAIATGEYCLRQDDFVRETRDRVRRERERLRAALVAAGFDVRPSAAPFLLLDIGDRGVDRVVERARERGVAVRDATTFRGLDSHVRVAVRRPAENDRLLAALDADGGDADRSETGRSAGRRENGGDAGV